MEGKRRRGENRKGKQKTMSRGRTGERAREKARETAEQREWDPRSLLATLSTRFMMATQCPASLPHACPCCDEWADKMRQSDVPSTATGGDRGRSSRRHRLV